MQTIVVRGFGELSFLGARKESETLPTYTATFFLRCTKQDDSEGSQTRRALAAIVSFCLKGDKVTAERINDRADFLIREVFPRPIQDPTTILLNRGINFGEIFETTEPPAAPKAPQV